jgi:hypothetical protein
MVAQNKGQQLNGFGMFVSTGQYFHNQTHRINICRKIATFAAKTETVIGIYP